MKPGTKLRVYRGEGLLAILEGKSIPLQPGERRRLAHDLVAEERAGARLVLYVEDGWVEGARVAGEAVYTRGARPQTPQALLCREGGAEPPTPQDTLRPL